MNVVSDTGPLIHLDEIGCSSLLATFHQIHIPEIVRVEFLKHREFLCADIFRFSQVRVHKVEGEIFEKFIEGHQLFHLHPGDKACLFLCQKLALNTLLTDDLAVRDAAQKLKITPVGSIGIIMKAFVNKIISRSLAEKYISDLYNISSLFITSTIIEMVIKEIRRFERDSKSEKSDFV